MPNRSISSIILISLLPCIAMWIGLSVCKSAIATLALYHGCCILPAILLTRKSWQHAIFLPKKNQIVRLLIHSTIFCGLTLLLYHLFGHKLLSKETARTLMIAQGYKRQNFFAVCLYFLVVNPLLEEIFWRGVIMEKLSHVQPKFRFALVWSSATYALFHYLIFCRILYQGWAELAVILLTVYGAMLATIYRRSRSLLLASLYHAFLTDLAAVLLMVTLLRDYNM